MDRKKLKEAVKANWQIIAYTAAVVGVTVAVRNHADKRSLKDNTLFLVPTKSVQAIVDGQGYFLIKHKLGDIAIIRG